MRTVLVALVPVAMLLNPLSGVAEPTCPRTVGYRELGPPLPKSPNWYGSEALAVQIHGNGVWGTTAPGANIAVKLAWWSAGFRVGMESNLQVTIRELSGAPMTARVSTPTNAYLSGGWTMMNGIDFPDPGCWEISGEYLGQKLTFVVETVRSPPITSSPADSPKPATGI